MLAVYWVIYCRDYLLCLSRAEPSCRLLACSSSLHSIIQMQYLRHQIFPTSCPFTNSLIHVNMSSSNDDLQELVLSSSSLLTSLHDVKTGSLLTAFKSSSSSGGAGSESASAYASTSSSKGKGREESASASSASQWRRTADVVDARDGQGGMVIAALPGGKGALNVWSFQRVGRNSFDLNANSDNYTPGSSYESSTAACKAHLPGNVKLWSIPRGRNKRWAFVTMGGGSL